MPHRPGVSKDRKFLNVLVSTEVIRQAKIAASSRIIPLNIFVEEAVGAAASELLTRNGHAQRKKAKGP